VVEETMQPTQASFWLRHRGQTEKRKLQHFPKMDEEERIHTKNS
jgi:hypothetical protein